MEFICIHISYYHWYIKWLPLGQQATKGRGQSLPLGPEAGFVLTPFWCPGPCSWERMVYNGWHLIQYLEFDILVYIDIFQKWLPDFIPTIMKASGNLQLQEVNIFLGSANTEQACWRRQEFWRSSTEHLYFVSFVHFYFGLLKECVKKTESGNLPPTYLVYPKYCKSHKHFYPHIFMKL